MRTQSIEVRVPRLLRAVPTGRKRHTLLATACFLVVGLLLAGCAATPKEPLLTDHQRQLNLESFDYVWTTIRDKHWDPELGGLDWPAVRDELRPRVEQASVMSESRAAMLEMISRLDQSHFGIVPAELYEEMEQPVGEGSRDGVIGFDVRVIEGQALVTSVEEGSPAAELGVRPGWQIARVGEAEITPTLQSLAEEFADKTYKDFVLARVVTSRLEGRVGDKIAVQFLNGEDEPVKLEIALIQRKGRRVQFGHAPAFYVWMDAHQLDERRGYIALSSFFDPAYVMSAFNDAMDSFMGMDGIVIDIRGNPGGVGAMAMGMAGWLVGEKYHRLGTMYTRDNEVKLVVYPRATTYEGKVAILVDGLSGSTSEFFAGGLKDLGRARIFGTRTAGAALPSTFEKLPNGDGFQYAHGNYVSEGGEVLEGVGVIPDVEVVPTRQALLDGHDPVLEAATAWIQKTQ